MAKSVNNSVDFKPVKKAVQKAEFASVAHTLAAIRLTAIRSIRRGKMLPDGKRNPSKPGKAPKTWDNRSRRFMKRNILYSQPKADGNNLSGSVFVSPDNAGEPVYRTLEYGGYAKIKVKKNGMQQGFAFTQRTRRAGNGRPPEQRSEGEKQHIREYYRKIAAQKYVTKSVWVKQRPFLDPAVKKNLPRIPAIWKANLQQYFR